MVCKSSLFLSWLLHKNIKVKMRIYVTKWYYLYYQTQDNKLQVQEIKTSKVYDITWKVTQLSTRLKVTWNHSNLTQLILRLLKLTLSISAKKNSINCNIRKRWWMRLQRNRIKNHHEKNEKTPPLLPQHSKLAVNYVTILYQACSWYFARWQSSRLMLL